MISAKVGDRVVEEERYGWSSSHRMRFRTVTKATVARLTTDDGMVWDRKTGRRVPKATPGRIRDEEPGDVARAALEVCRWRVRDDLSTAARHPDQLTNDEVVVIDTVLRQIAARLRASVR